jgi:hypothetical protein
MEDCSSSHILYDKVTDDVSKTARDSPFAYAMGCSKFELAVRLMFLMILPIPPTKHTHTHHFYSLCPPPPRVAWPP